MDEPNPYRPPRCPLSGPGDRAPSRSGRVLTSPPRVGAIVGSCLLIPAYLALFVMGRDPNGDGAWGWCLGSILSGVGVGSLYGVLIGGAIGWIVGAVRRGLRRDPRIDVREPVPTKSGSPE